MRSNGRRACSSGSRQVWWTYSAAPWSMHHSRPCHHSRLGLATVRSGLVTSPSSQTMAAAWAGSTSGRGGRVERQGAGQEVEPEVAPGAGPDEVVDLLVGLGVAQARVDLDRDEVRARAARACRPMAPATHSATSARGPWPAPRNLTTYSPSSSASTRPGSEPPSRSGRHVAGRGHGPEHVAQRSRAADGGRVQVRTGVAGTDVARPGYASPPTRQEDHDRHRTPARSRRDAHARLKRSRRTAPCSSNSSPRPAGCTTATPRSPRSGSPTSSSRTASAATSTRSPGPRTSRG